MNTPKTAEMFYNEHEREEFVSKPECIRLMELYHQHQVTDGAAAIENEAIKKASFENGLRSG